MDPLLGPALATVQTFLAHGNELMPTPLGTLVRNRRAPKIWDANHVAHPAVASAEDVDRLLARVEDHWAGFAHRRIDLDAASSPLLEARLARDGWVERRHEVMAVDRDLGGAARPLDIRPIAGDAGWAAFAALRALAWAEEARRIGLSGDPGVATEMCLVLRAKAPPVRWWLAAEDGVPCGYCASWEGRGGVGQLDDLFVHPAHRHRGIATALVRHAVRECRARGAGAVVLVADPDDTPRTMYAAMGFRTLGPKRGWLRRT